ncbi:MAG: hypothetical protein DRJ42_15000 [Deltaproteobacteria bacterium]|nr:MAG: hypothetical protein DRJ42_15000 [Deltaproteobacteria bacterium]
MTSEEPVKTRLIFTVHLALLSLLALSAATSLGACKRSPSNDDDRGAFGTGDVGPRTPALAGREVFRANCQGCHAPGAVGSERGPALTAIGIALAAGAHDSVVRTRLADGGQEMPAFTHLTRSEIDAVIGYLVEVGGGRPAPEPSIAALGGVALGEHLFQSNCAGCHGVERTVTTGISCRPADLAGATTRFTKEQVMNLLNSGVGPMPAYAHLTLGERDALWGYLGTLDAGPNAPQGASCGMVQAAMEGRGPGAGGGCGCGGRRAAATGAAAGAIGAPGAPAAAGCGCGRRRAAAAAAAAGAVVAPGAPAAAGCGCGGGGRGGGGNCGGAVAAPAPVPAP